jgi:hypothetical protein
MSRATHPADPTDIYNPPPDAPVIMHDPADPAVQGYREAAEKARRSGPGRVYQDPRPEAPAGPQLPYLHVAQVAAGREIQRLSCQVEAGRRELASRFVFTASGQQVSDPGLIAMRAELAAQIDAAEAEISRIQGLDELEVRKFAYDRGAR